MWDKIASSTEFYRINNGDSGTNKTPQFGDILVFNQGSGSWSSGHVAVVKEVSGGRIYFIQQNVKDKVIDSLPINNSYIENEGRYPVILGWIRYN